MPIKLLPGTCLAIVAACSAAEWARGDYATINPKDLDARVELLSPPPLPYQPVRLRLIIRNVSQKRLGPRLPPVDHSRDALVRRAQDDRYLPARAGLWFYDSIIPTALATRNSRSPLYLNPGEQTSVSFALGRRNGETGPREVALPEGGALFPEPGEYWLKCLYTVGVKDSEYVHVDKEIKIEVREPQAADRGVYEALRRNPQLASVLLEGTRPPEAALVPKIEALLELFPESSYADYARFALARFYLKGNGFQPSPAGRIDLAKAATHLEKVYQGQRFSAYHPNAMIAMRSADPHFYEINKVAIQLADRYSDSVEWLEQFALILGDPIQKHRDLVKLITGRDYPSIKDPFEQQRAMDRFKTEVWTTYRKRVPGDQGQKEPRP